MVRFGDCSAQIEWLHWQCKSAKIHGLHSMPLFDSSWQVGTYVQCVCMCATIDITKYASAPKKCAEILLLCEWSVATLVGKRRGRLCGTQSWQGECRKQVSKFHVGNIVRKFNCELYDHSCCSCRFRTTTLVSFLGRSSIERETSIDPAASHGSAFI